MSSNTASDGPATSIDPSRARYGRFLLLVAGLGGLLFGVDVGIIGGALPYLEATSGLNPGQLSIIVAAVLLGSVISTLFAGVTADWIGRKNLMVISGIAFVLSIPTIALSNGFEALFLGRLLQGVSGGFIGVVVPLYLAECLPASVRGKGTGIFQWLLTLGIVLAAVIGIYYSYRVEEVRRLSSAATLFAFEDQAWRRIFWVSLPPGILFIVGSLMVAESPRWLFRKGRLDEARKALLRSRTPEQCDIEMREMQAVASGAEQASREGRVKDSLLRRKYVIPFLLACIILFCNTATGINSIIGYNTNILLQSGLSDLQAHWGYVLFTLINFSMTVVGFMLVDRKGRKFLLIVGSAGIIVSVTATGFLFLRTERLGVDCKDSLQSMVKPDGTLSMQFDPAEVRKLLATRESSAGIPADRATMTVIYSYAGFSGQSNVVRSNDKATWAVNVTREKSLPAGSVEAFFRNPAANLSEAQRAPLQIDKALVGSIPSALNGWMVALSLYIFMAFYAIGPGVCVWLALSELMPSRIRSNGMSVALVINQLVSTTLAAIFLPVVGAYGYSFIFFLFAGFTVIYFLTAVFLLPETKGKTLEEIEKGFERRVAEA